MTMTPVNNYWNEKLNQLKETLRKNKFEAQVAQSPEEAKQIVLEKIVPACNPKTISFGGSLTVKQSGLYDYFLCSTQFKVIDTYSTDPPLEERLERRRQGLLSDMFLTGSNALTLSGEVVNLDGLGNRVAAISFGPKKVVLLIGRNKVVQNLAEAKNRIKEYAAPVNTIRLDKKTPCAKTMRCENCNSPDRICNYWSIVERSFPPGRISIVLINQDLGF